MPLLENTGFKHKEKLTGIVTPHQQAVLSKISSLLAKYNIKTIHIPAKKYIHMLTPTKDKLELKVRGTHCIPRKCSKVYVGQTGRNIETRCKEHETCLSAREVSCDRAKI
jgi:hypothetical protein